LAYAASATASGNSSDASDRRRGCDERHVGESLRDSPPVSEKPAHVNTLRGAGIAIRAFADIDHVGAFLWNGGPLTSNLGEQSGNGGMPARRQRRLG